MISLSLTALLKKITGRGPFIFPRLHEEEILALGALFLCAAFAGIMAWDGYLFYHAVIRKRAPAAAPSEKELSFAGRLDEALKILDERKKNFEEKLPPL